MYGLLEYAIYDSFSGVVYPVAVSIKSQSGGNNFAAYGEVSGIKYVERAILQACPSGVNSFLSACCAALAQSGDHNCIVSSTGSIVNGDSAVSKELLDNGSVQSSPVVLSGSQSSGGSNGQHVDIVTYAVAYLAAIQLSLYGRGSTGGVSVLTNDYAATADKGVCSFCFSSGIIPRVGIHNIHVYIGYDGLDAEEESGVAGNYFCIGVSANIAYIGIRYGACVHELLELHTGYDTGYIAALEGVGEDVAVVIHAFLKGSHITGSGDELYFGIFHSSLQHEGLMAVGVGDYQSAALLNKVYSVVIALFIFGYIVLIDDLVIGEAEGSLGAFNTFDMGHVITGVLVVYENNADLNSSFLSGSFFYYSFLSGSFFNGGSFFCSGGSTCYQAESKNQSQNNSYEFLHVVFSSL